MSDVYRLRTKASSELILRLKLHATNGHRPLMDLYVEALTHLMTERSRFRAEGRSVQYFLAPRKERHLHIRIPRTLARLVSSAAREDAVPLDTFAYTALFSYEVSHVFPIPTHPLLLMKSEPVLSDRPIEEGGAMAFPLTPAEHLDRARTEFNHVFQLIEQLWLRERMQYAAVRELEILRRDLALATTAVVRGTP